jgi:hypothetical protein
LVPPALFVVTVAAVPGVNYTPLRTKPLLLYMIIAALWLGLTAWRGVRGRGGKAFGVAVGLVLVAALFAVATSLWVGPLWTPTFTASPVDARLIDDMSRFRSCAGHDYSGAPVESPGETESDRSMKHYLSLSVKYGDMKEVPVRAMADGVITRVVDVAAPSSESALGFEGNFSGEVALTVSGFAPFGFWEIRYMHVHPTVANGKRVSAGDIIGTVPPSDWRKVVDRDGKLALLPTHPVQFDVALEFFPLMPFGKGKASFVRYLSADLKKAYDAKGFTAEATTTSRAERDARPCATRYNDDPGADWVHADAVRTAADKAASAGGPTSTLPNVNNGQNGNPSDPFADRPECNSAILGAQWQAQTGSLWTCMKTAEGNIAWGPATPSTTAP